MKNSHLKNSLLAAGIAVFAGVVTLGVNVAFGDTAPTLKPADTTLVSPTFNNLTVTGAVGADSLNVAKGIQIGNVVFVSDPSSTINAAKLDGKPFEFASIVKFVKDIVVAGKATVNSLAVTNNIDALTGAVNAQQVVATDGITGGFLKTKGALTAGAIALTDDLGIESTSPSGALRFQSPIDVWYGIVNNGVDNVGKALPVKISDDLTVTGKVGITQTGGSAGTNTALNLTAGNTNSYFGNNQVTFGYNGNNQYMHAIKSRHNANGLAGNALDFYVWDQLADAIGTVGSKQVMTLDGNGNVGIGTAYPQAALDVNGSIVNSLSNFGGGQVVVQDNLYVAGPSIVSNKGFIMDAVNGTLTALGGMLTIPGNLVTEQLNTKTLITTSDITAGAKIKATGHVTASGGFGTNYVKNSAMVGFAAALNDSQEAGVTCDTHNGVVDPLVSCNAGTADILNNFSDWTRFILISRVNADTTTQTCKVRGTNNSSAVHYIWAQAVCSNPGL